MNWRMLRAAGLTLAIALCVAPAAGPAFAQTQPVPV